MVVHRMPLMDQATILVEDIAIMRILPNFKVLCASMK